MDREAGQAEMIVDAPGESASDVERHVAVVFDDDANRASIDVNGVPVAGAALTGPLSALSDVNNWLGGRSFLLTRSSRAP